MFKPYCPISGVWTVHKDGPHIPGKSKFVRLPKPKGSTARFGPVREWKTREEAQQFADTLNA